MQSNEELWGHVLEANKAYVQAADRFLREAHRPVDVLRRGLRGDVMATLTAFGLLSRLPAEERVQVLAELLELCTSPRFASFARPAILGLPREWLLANLEGAAEPLLQYADHLQYSMLLGLYEAIDRSLALELAKRAAENADYDIKEVGQTYLLQSKLG